MPLKGLIITFTSLLSRNLGGHRIATHLREQGWDIEVVDFGNFWSSQELKTLISQRCDANLKFIGFSYLHSYMDGHSVIEDVCTWTKIKYPNVMLIGGGQVPTNHQYYLDYYIAGYGEVAIDALLKYKFSNGMPVKSSRYGKTNVIDATHDYVAYPDKSSMVRYEPRDFIQSGEWGQIEMSRGCKFKCKFCSYPVLGVNYDATRTSESAREQMLHAYDNYGIENYLIIDDTFNDHTSKITKFADMVETLPWKPYFSGLIRMDLLVSRSADREELLRLGMLGQFHGIETFHPAAAKFIGKGMNPDKLKNGMLDVYSYFEKHSGEKYRIACNFVAGLPYETKESLEETYIWLRDVWYPRPSSCSVLEINKVPGKYDRSFIAENVDSLGYKEIVGNHLNNFAKNIDDEHRLLWENDNMDMNYASDWCNRVSNLHNLGNKFKSIPHLSNHSIRVLQPADLTELHCHEDGTILSLEEKLKLNEYSSKTFTRNAKNLFINSYKQKKLGI